MEYLVLKLCGFVFFSTICYRYANIQVPKYNWELPIDKKIKVVPLFIFPYFFLFPLVFITFLLTAYYSKNTTHEYLNSLIITHILAFLFWLLFPNGVRRTLLPETKLGKIINFLYKHDKDTGGFPSAHVFIALISIYFSFQVSLLIGILIALIGSAVILSTIFIKQHYVVDLFGGFLFALIGVYLVLFLIEY